MKCRDHTTHDFQHETDGDRPSISYRTITDHFSFSGSVAFEFDSDSLVQHGLHDIKICNIMLMLCDQKRKMYTHWSEIVCNCCCCFCFVVASILSSLLPSSFLLVLALSTDSSLVSCFIVLALAALSHLLSSLFRPLPLFTTFLQMLTISIRWTHKSQSMSLTLSLPTLYKRIDVWLVVVFFSICIFFRYFTSYRVLYIFYTLFLNISLL